MSVLDAQAPVPAKIEEQRGVLAVGAQQQRFMPQVLG